MLEDNNEITVENTNAEDTNVENTDNTEHTEDTVTGSTKYFKFLVKNFGCANLRGCLQLAKILELYNIEDPEIAKCYRKLAEIENTTVTAIERNIRTYISIIEKRYTIAELSSTLDYTFKPGTERLMISDLLPALKLYIDEI